MMANRPLAIMEVMAFEAGTGGDCDIASICVEILSGRVSEFSFYLTATTEMTIPPDQRVG